MADPDLELEYNKGYTNALFFFGHNGIKMGQRNVSPVLVDKGICVVNINPIGKIATYTQVKAFYEFAKNDLERFLLDPWRNKNIIETLVNKGLVKDHINLSIAVGDIMTTPDMQAFPYADLAGSTDTEGKPVADITLSGIFTLKNLQKTRTFEPFGKNDGNITWDDIMRCYDGSISPTIENLKRDFIDIYKIDPTEIGLQSKLNPDPKNNKIFYWDDFFNRYEFNARNIFDIIKPYNRSVFYNLGCRVLTDKGTSHIARQNSIKKVDILSLTLGPPYPYPENSNSNSNNSPPTKRAKTRKTRRKSRK